jgi:hypothetical protein
VKGRRGEVAEAEVNWEPFKVALRIIRQCFLGHANYDKLRTQVAYAAKCFYLRCLPVTVGMLSHIMEEPS